MTHRWLAFSAMYFGPTKPDCANQYGTIILAGREIVSPSAPGHLGVLRSNSKQGCASPAYTRIRQRLGLPRLCVPR